MIAKFISLILVSIVSGLDDEGEWRLEIHSNSVLHGYHHHLPTIAPGPLTRQELQSEDRAAAEITESMIDAIEYISLADKQMSQRQQYALTQAQAIAIRNALDLYEGYLNYRTEVKEKGRDLQKQVREPPKGLAAELKPVDKNMRALTKDAKAALKVAKKALITRSRQLVKNVKTHWKMFSKDLRKRTKGDRKQIRKFEKNSDKKNDFMESKLEKEQDRFPPQIDEFKGIGLNAQRLANSLDADVEGQTERVDKEVRSRRRMNQ